MSSNLTITNKTHAIIPRALFKVIKKEVLGSKYNLSLVFTTSAQIKKLNMIYRDKRRATDILSFPLSESEGEIHVCPSEARKKAKKFGRTFDNFVKFLFIHGCVHLKGYDHGGTMESIEAGVRARFKI